MACDGQTGGPAATSSPSASATPTPTPTPSAAPGRSGPERGHHGDILVAALPLPQWRQAGGQEGQLHRLEPGQAV